MEKQAVARVTRRGLLGLAVSAMAASMVPGLLRAAGRATGGEGSTAPGWTPANTSLKAWFSVRRGDWFRIVEGSVSSSRDGRLEVRPAQPLGLQAGDVVTIHSPMDDKVGTGSLANGGVVALFIHPSGPCPSLFYIDKCGRRAYESSRGEYQWERDR